MEVWDQTHLKDGFFCSAIVDIQETLQLPACKEDFDPDQMLYG